MTKTNKNKLIELFEYILPILFAAGYFCMEPMLTQMYLIRGWSIVYWPYSIIRYVCIPLIYILFFVRIIMNKGKINYGALGAITIFYLCYLIPCLGNSEGLMVWGETVGQNIAYFIIVLPIAFSEKYMKKFIGACSWLYLVLAAVNLIFKVFPGLFDVIGSWTPESFLTTIENLAGFPLVMGVFFCLLDNYFRGGKIKLAAFLMIYFVSNYLMWTASQIVGAMIIFLYLIPPIRRIFNKIDLLVLFGIAFSLFVVFVWLWEPIMNLQPIKYFIVDVLKKDLTFSGRRYIWQNIWEMTKENIAFGHGLMENPQMMFLDMKWNGNWVHAHNAFLQTMYEGGLVTILGLIVMFVYVSQKLRTNEDKAFVGICNVCIFAFFINLEMDQFFIYPWRTCMWCMVCFICNFAVVMTNRKSSNETIEGKSEY